MRVTACLSIVGAVLLSGCVATSHELRPEDVTGPQVWGSADNVMHLSRLYFSEQPDEAGLQAAREAGVTAVIDLRMPDETDFDEVIAARNAGLTYYQVPVDNGDSFEPATMKRISELVSQHPGEAMLLHCSSGNRAAAWLAIHLVQDHGLDFPSALEIARRSGLTRPDMEARVRRYLNVPAPR